jgi:hypothetical protein
LYVSSRPIQDCDISLLGAIAVTDRGLITVLKICPKITHVKITGMAEVDGKVYGNFTGFLTSRTDKAPILASFNLEHQPLKAEVLQTLSKKRPTLLIVGEHHVYAGQSLLRVVRTSWRGGEGEEIHLQDSEGLKLAKRMFETDDESDGPRPSKAAKSSVPTDYDATIPNTQSCTLIWIERKSAMLGAAVQRQKEEQQVQVRSKDLKKSTKAPLGRALRRSAPVEIVLTGEASKRERTTMRTITGPMVRTLLISKKE